MRLADPEQLFARFQQDALTKGGARDQFEMLLLDLVKVQMPGATTVSGKGGNDWGIDALVGRFSESGLGIWQCKFVLEWHDDGPQNQVRESFKSAVKQAAENNYKIRSWTLCVPCILAPDQQKWFDGWAARQQRVTKIKISIWNGVELRHQLLRADALDVRREYFPHTLPARQETAPFLEPLAEADDMSQFDGALFIRQLREAGESETDPACGLFYATDALVRDYTEKGDAEAIDALKELHLDVHRVWSHRFNEAAPTAGPDGRMPSLHHQVMDDASTRPDPGSLRLRPVHKMGAAHRLVEDSKAGWVLHWRDVAADHLAARSATEAVVPESGDIVEVDLAEIQGAAPTASSTTAVDRDPVPVALGSGSVWLGVGGVGGIGSIGRCAAGRGWGG